MPPAPVLPSLQDKLLHECRIFKANMDTQSNILLCDPDGRGTERIGDVILAVAELDIQADRIISIALGMLAEASDSEIMRRNTSFWLRAHNGYHKFENVFYGMKREMSQLLWILKQRPE